MYRAMILGAALVLVASEQAKPEENNWRELCKVISESAETIMKQRQSGQSMSRLMDRMDGDDEMSGMMRSIIIEAYDRPRYSTDEMIQRSVEDFTNQAYLDCAKQFDG